MWLKLLVDSAGYFDRIGWEFHLKFGLEMVDWCCTFHLPEQSHPPLKRASFKWSILFASMTTANEKMHFNFTSKHIWNILHGWRARRTNCAHKGIEFICWKIPRYALSCINLNKLHTIIRGSFTNASNTNLTIFSRSGVEIVYSYVFFLKSCVRTDFKLE